MACGTDEPPSVAAEGAYEENFIPIHHSFDHRNKREGSAGKAAEVSAQKPDLAPSAPQSTAQGGANMRKQQAKQYQRYVQWKNRLRRLFHWPQACVSKQQVCTAQLEQLELTLSNVEMAEKPN